MGPMAGSRPIVPSRLAPGGVVHGRSRRPTSLLGGYIALMKLRVVELLLISTLPTMVLAQRGWPPATLIVVTLIGGTLAAGGANAINMVIDRDIDALMPRTAGRPTVTGLISPGRALAFAVGLEVAAFAILWWGANLLSAILALAACLFYVFVYTILLKRHTSQNIVIGGAAGAVPVLVGWAAVRNDVAWPAWLLFAVIFLWTPPHTWALAMRHAEEYRAANVPMLPAVATPAATVRQMIAYTAAMVAASLVLVVREEVGWIYGLVAGIVGLAFLAATVDLGRRPSPQRAMRVFAWSISYITLLFVAIAVDVLVRYGWSGRAGR